MYKPMNVNVFTDQHDKLKNAITHERPVSIKLNIEKVGGEQHTLLLTGSQIEKIKRSKLIGKRQVTIRLSKKQLLANVRHQGGFLGILSGLAAKALPTLLGGLASGLVSGAVKRVVAKGDGLYLHKSGHCVKVEPVKGNGLYLTPYAKESVRFITISLLCVCGMHALMCSELAGKIFLLFRAINYFFLI